MHKTQRSAKQNPSHDVKSIALSADSPFRPCTFTAPISREADHFERVLGRPARRRRGPSCCVEGSRCRTSPFSIDRDRSSLSIAFRPLLSSNYSSCRGRRRIASYHVTYHRGLHPLLHHRIQQIDQHRWMSCCC